MFVLQYQVFAFIKTSYVSAVRLKWGGPCLVISNILTHPGFQSVHFYS